MPFSGNIFTLPAGSKTSNGVLSDAELQHNAPLTDIENALTNVKSSLAAASTPVVRSRPALQAIDPDIQANVDLDEGARGGPFSWTLGDYAARVTADTEQARYIGSSIPAKPTTLGAWVRRTDRPFSHNMFGTRSGSGLDDTSAFNKFLDVISNEQIDNIDWSGDLSTTGNHTFGPASGDCLNKRISGKLKIRTLSGSSGASIFRMRNNANPSIDYLEMVGRGGGAYGPRGSGFVNGLDLENVTRINAGTIIASALSGYAVSQPNTQANGENNNLNIFGLIKAFDCGSGHGIGDTYVGTLQGTFDMASVVNAGGSDSGAQTSTFTASSAAALPPQTLSTLSDLPTPMYVRINGRYYYITAVDYVLNKITVFPWIDPALSGTAVPYALTFGGGVLTLGGNSNAFRAHLIDCTRCGIGFTDAAQYGCAPTFLNASVCGIGAAIGQSPGSVVSGGDLSVYMEANIADIVMLARGSITNANYKISSELTMDITKIPNMRSPRLTGGAISTTFASLGNLFIDYNGRSLFTLKKPANIDDIVSGTSLGFTVDFTDGIERTFRRDTSIVTVTPPEAGINAVTGNNVSRFAVTGTGSGGSAPTSITINVPANLTKTVAADATTDWITSTSPSGAGLVSGNKVQFTTTGTLPAPLTTATDYWVSRNEGDDKYKLHTSFANATAVPPASPIDITTAGTGTHTMQIPYTLNGGTSAIVNTTFTGTIQHYCLYWIVGTNDIQVLRD